MIYAVSQRCPGAAGAGVCVCVCVCVGEVSKRSLPKEVQLEPSPDKDVVLASCDGWGSLQTNKETKQKGQKRSICKD